MNNSNKSFAIILREIANIIENNNNESGDNFNEIVKPVEFNENNFSTKGVIPNRNKNTDPVEDYIKSQEEKKESPKEKVDRLKLELARAERDAKAYYKKASNPNLITEEQFQEIMNNTEPTFVIADPIKEYNDAEDLTSNFFIGYSEKKEIEPIGPIGVKTNTNTTENTLPGGQDTDANDREHGEKAL